MKYYTHYRGFMIFKKLNGYFCPSINEDLNCTSANDTWEHIDFFIRECKMKNADISFSLRGILLNPPNLN